MFLDLTMGIRALSTTLNPCDSLSTFSKTSVLIPDLVITSLRKVVIILPPPIRVAVCLVLPVHWVDQASQTVPI